LLPRHPIDISGRLRALPEDGHLPGLDDWQWVHTPGHTPGHVSFWNPRTKALIAGDAIITTKQESLRGAVFRGSRLQGPPAYFTPDWNAARCSIQRLADLRPDLLISGHGPALHGAELAAGLQTLLSHFHEYGLPQDSRYMPGHPVTYRQ
jgi:glyoxylase-like metal-dependent hydrolase (beta-lactamase superfamily II)